MREKTVNSVVGGRLELEELLLLNNNSRNSPRNTRNTLLFSIAAPQPQQRALVAPSWQDGAFGVGAIPASLVRPNATFGEKVGAESSESQVGHTRGARNPVVAKR